MIDIAPVTTAPTTARLVKAIVSSLVAAVVILVVFVLPAEYGIDPLGTGAALGLVPEPALELEAEPAPATLGPTPLVPTPMGPLSYFPAAYATDRATFALGPYEYVEYKYRLEAGATMHFSWQATAPVVHDFHGAPDAPGEKGQKEVSFDKLERRRGFGAYTAPFAGMHGWYWENPGGTPITVTITTSGFYSSPMEHRSNRRRTAHQVTPLEP